MAVPARKTSKTRKRLRRTHYKLTAPGMSTCPNCGELRKSHHVCSNCGYYGDKEVVKVKQYLKVTLEKHCIWVFFEGYFLFSLVVYKYGKMVGDN